MSSTVTKEQVSIRDADFLLFEQGRWIDPAGNVVKRFNPRCGFFAVRTEMNGLDRLINNNVSIRDADFLLFELRHPGTKPRNFISFNPRCGFFAVRTLSSHP